MNRKIQYGFTLIEVIVAMFIFAVISVTAHVMLSSILNLQKHFDEHTDRMRALQLTVKYLERDIFQLSDRETRDRFGDRQIAVQLDDERMTMTYSGLRNPAGLTRSQMQRVAYEFNNHQLTRLAWAQLDGYSEEAPVKRQLIDNIEEFRLEFLDEQDNWSEQWPPANLNQNAPTRPKAIAVTFDMAPWGELRRVFPTPR